MTGTVQGSIRPIKVCANGGRSRDDHPGVGLASSNAELILLALDLWARSGPR